MTKVAKSKSTVETKREGLHDAFRKMVGAEEIIEAGARLGVIQRQRKVDLPALVEATILAVMPVPASSFFRICPFLLTRQCGGSVHEDST